MKTNITMQKKRNKIVIIISALLGLLLLMSGCGNHKDNSNDDFPMTDFPRDKQGYPENHVVIINGTEYSIKDLGSSHVESNIDQEIKLKDFKKGDCIEVILPQYLPVYLWGIEDKETIDFINYDKKELSVQEDVEGKSAFVQKFTFIVGEDTSIFFKWFNVNECGKSFDEKEEEYLLKISIA